MQARISYTLLESLPPLSWMARLNLASSILEVTHGASVRCRDGFFSEGAWSGTLDGEGLLAACVSAASGCVVRGQRFVFVAPSNTMARLHVVKGGDWIAVSNSLPFVLAACGLQPDLGYLRYESDFSSVIKGLGRETRRIRMRGGTVEMYVHCHLEVSASGDLIQEPLPAPPSFSSFQDYRDFLIDSLSTMLAQAKSGAEADGGYEPIVSLSRGYDSPACAALAHRVGCRDAFTFFDLRAVEPLADCGSEIAQIIGLRCLEVSREEYKSCECEAEFLATGTGGDGVFIGALGGVLSRRALITGFHGDKIWDPGNSQFDPPIKRGDPSGADLEEFRLRLDFIHVPVPFFGCTRLEDIHAISNSDEMSSWRVGGDYDRPVPRRLAEAAGVPRNMFGQRKRVMSRAFNEEGQAVWYFSAASIESLRRFAAPLSKAARSPSFRLLHAIARAREGSLSFLQRRVSFRLARVLETLTWFLDAYTRDVTAVSFRFHWGVTKTMERYASALRVGKQQTSTRGPAHPAP